MVEEALGIHRIEYDCKHKNRVVITWADWTPKEELDRMIIEPKCIAVDGTTCERMTIVEVCHEACKQVPRR